MSEFNRDDAAMICAQLLRQGYVEKKAYPKLQVDEQLLQNVKNRLAQVGMELVINSYSSYYAVKLNENSQTHVEESNNLGLKTNETAMLVILWCKLVLPKRVVSEGSPAPRSSNKEQIAFEQGTFIEKNKKGKSKEGLYVKVAELYAEFGKQFGSKTSFKSAITRLSNLQFINLHNEVISEGLFLDLLIDGSQMGNEIKKSALAYKLAGLGEEDLSQEWEEDFPEEQAESELEEDEPLIELSEENVIRGQEVMREIQEEQQQQQDNQQAGDDKDV